MDDSHMLLPALRLPGGREEEEEEYRHREEGRGGEGRGGRGGGGGGGGEDEGKRCSSHRAEGNVVVSPGLQETK